MALLSGSPRSISLVVALVLAVALPGAASADTNAAEPVTGSLLEPFMKALQEPDEARSSKATLPFVHRSLWNGSGDDLAPDLKRFSFKKAHTNAGLYATPVKVVRITTTAISAIGVAPAVEQGTVVDYFLERKSAAGASVSSGPVRVFFPRAGGPPKVVYMGSL